ncbi:type IV secretion protein Rhs [Acinetobacter qingfengensis]|uniref:Type IV secretion protein Rhs n=1 Tax=Acinetobacter qingfengensis TaxID=1262585 RepID=A0A1E7REG0_9GAMM|nr:type IV secretion protein Rhs [Acinetobacter qingfengensis]KAA8734371.1 type IV secretion protein Rhs [Acinetobacter qingfengensis]OEY97642.1 type IV secretion protein Rhs [Acinetobacter qingfengensis]
MIQILKHFLFSKKMVVQRRFLTVGEKKLAFEVFAEHLKLDQIEIVAHRLMLRHYAMSPNGNVYFHPKDWVEDFSKESIATQSWLIHELTHVWQVQQGMALIRKALFDRRYRYVLKEGKKFLQYGVEQQAQMVQDYFLKSKTGQSCQDLADCIPFIAASMPIKNQKLL